MTTPIEGYALIGNTRTAALVGRDGSIDWLCAPRFDSRAFFAALLGTREHGRWLLAPRAKVHAVRRSYRADTLVLETEFETEHGTMRLIDCMPPWPDRTEDPWQRRGRPGHWRRSAHRRARSSRSRTCPSWISSP